AAAAVCLLLHPFPDRAEVPGIAGLSPFRVRMRGAILTRAADKISMSSPFMPTHCAGIGMKEHIHSHVFATTAALDEQLAIAVASWLDDALRQRGEALLVVSGGRTPIHFFHRLATQAIEWEKVAVTLADERWVEPSHEGSNERLVREHLLIDAAAQARLVPLKNSAVTAPEGEADCEAALATFGRFDVVVLGMGNDGHTASLFPDAPELRRGLDMQSGKACVAMTPTAAPHQRMSLTLPRLLNAARIVVHVVGEEKRKVLDRALQLDSTAPISAVLHQRRVPVDVYYAAGAT